MKNNHLRQKNVSLLKQKASKLSIYGVVIALTAIVVATLLSSYFNEGEITLASITKVQKTNPVLWIIDIMPFIFAFWGQYVSFTLSHEANTMIIDQTYELRTQTELIQKKAAHEATHDSLTGLPNRTLFIDRLQQASHTAKRDGSIFAVLILDVDRFKEVNDTLGHYNGDRLLKLIALRLSGIIRESDTLARIGGDEFGFILPVIKKQANLKKIAHKIKTTFAIPFMLEKLSVEVTASIGATLFPEHGKEADTLIQRADVAMYAAKQDNLGLVVYSKKFDKHSPNRLTLMGELRQAIKNDGLVLHYQPKVVSETSQIYAVEALVRWEHPANGFMPPNEFIPLAERTGLIDDLTVWVIRKSLEQCSIWHKNQLSIGIAVNVSSQCLLDPQFPEILTGLLASYDFPAEFLTMEITETSVMIDPERSLAILNRIKKMGVRLSIDDFGTGYSSLAYLKKLPVSELKIDKSFVTDMLTNEDDTTIVNATIQLAHNLRLKVVAEGVENQETFNRLREMGCDSQQGFYISKPVPANEIPTWYKQL